MRSRSYIILGLSLLLLGIGLIWLRQSTRPTAPSAAVADAKRFTRVATTNQTTTSASTAPIIPGTTNKQPRRDPLDFRLANTSKTSGQLLRDNYAILLENALIDVRQPVGFKFPDRLTRDGDAGSYIVQSRGPIDDAFSRAVTRAGAEFVSYIPNNAWLVRASKAGADQLAANPETQAVLPWEPVYKLKSELLVAAMENKALPADAKLNVLIYNGAQAEVLAAMEKLQVQRFSEERSPFGTVVTVSPGSDWLALARLPGVQILERAYPRAIANDLTRVRVGVAVDTHNPTNYLGLTGTNILLGVNDSGVDSLHPDFDLTRLLTTDPTMLFDTSGHGTHVAGIMAGSGLASTNVQNARGSINPATNLQYRGIAPAAKLYLQRYLNTDAELQQNSALTNALISNNSWVYLGNSTYSLAAASYDAAVRDSLPGRTGSQPVLFVFSAGNEGDGSDTGLGGLPGTVMSPATAKNVIAVGALESLRDITNVVEKVTSGVTNKSKPWQGMTSSDFQVAPFSSRGNVGVRIEGDYGRIKPDVVAPGTFVIAPRSTGWDQVAYYNRTNHNRSTLTDQLVETGDLNVYPVFIPENTVGFTVNLIGNEDSPVPFPDLPLYLRRTGPPTTATFDLRRTNSVAVPPDLGGVGTAVGQNWFFAVGNNTGDTVAFDIVMDVITTNDLGNYFEVLSNLNNSISSTNLTTTNYYRYESGTSMAAPVVTGTLGLMEEFFEQRLQKTNSPALMKALLINGARTVANIYDFQTRNTINYQGWGLINLPNSLPNTISNAFNLGQDASGAIKLVEQSPTNALATGQSRTYSISFAASTNELVYSAPLRVTLAWTDPAANPAAGVKLVNDLDLIVTNRDTGDIYWGNDFPNGDPYTSFWDTNDPPNIDSINNIENVYISPFLGTNYDITIVARRVNVNAVTAHTNDVVQDYALVISSGNGDVPDAFQVKTIVQNAQQTSPATFVTNTINQPSDFVASFLEGQRVGANTPLLPVVNSTNGMTNQWKYFVVTNGTTFTNATFLISQHADLATHRMGVFADTDQATRLYADLDLYVSVNASGLTNLDPAVVSASAKSLTRNNVSGDEYVIFTNSVQNDVYYVGVKSEDQMAGQFDFFAIFSLLPLGAEDANGFVRAYPMNGYEIPEGPPSNPGGVRFVAITLPSTTGDPQSIRRVVVTNQVQHSNLGDLINTVDHNSRVVVLDNHRSIAVPPPPGPYSFLYDDSGENDYPNSISTDGPGSLNTFQGENPGGTWYFTYSDDALTQLGRVDDVRIRVERQCESDCDITNTIAGNSWRYYSRNIPVEATNLTICLNIIGSNPQPLQLYVRKDFRPTATVYDFTKTITPPSGCLTIDKSTLPPLESGRYFIGIFNPNTTAQEFVYSATVLLGPTPKPTLFSPTNGTVPMIDDAVTNFTQFITNDSRIAQVDVGLRIDHPRVSDLAVTLVSPRGTRVLLVENRGGTTTNGFGSTVTITNFVPVAANGGAAAQTNFIETASVFGTFTVDYDFFGVPDQMTIYYEGVQLFDTGLVSGAGRLNLSYGPGTSTQIEIRMNANGNPSTNTAWNYSVSSFNNIHSYLTFSDNTNLATAPIKFATPPYVGTTGASTLISDFELPTLVQDYNAPSLGTPDGWNVLTNRVTVVSNTAASGTNSLALRAGQINRVLPTVAGQDYTLRYSYRKVPSLDGIVAWWPGNSNTLDIIGGNNGLMTPAPSFIAGEVSSAFNFTPGSVITVPASLPLNVGAAGQGFTLEMWINPSSVASQQPLMEWRLGGGNTGAHFWISVGSPGTLYANLCDLTGGNNPIISAANTIQPGVWQHVALTYAPNGTTTLYRNGVPIVTQALGIFTPKTDTPFLLGRRLDIQNIQFVGGMDEPTIIRGALTADQIRDIYSAGPDGKCGMIAPPATTPCAAFQGAQIYIPGFATNTFLGNAVWQSGALFFTANGSNTTVGLQPVNPFAASGVLVDRFTLSEAASSLYVLPEQSLKAFEGENAFGEWQLEVLDTRTGATNNVSLLDWQLQFIFQSASVPVVITPGTLVTNTICSQQIAYYLIDVPTFARFATNQLFFATGPINVYFNQNIRPTGTNITQGDVTLLSLQTNGIVVLNSNSIPPLVPGQRYYIGIQNPSTNSCVDFGFVVDFDLATFPPQVGDLTNAVPVCTANPGPVGAIDYYRFLVASNSVRAQFSLTSLNGDLTLLLRRQLPPNFAVFDYLSANVFTNDEVINVYDFSSPVGLTPGEWYVGVGNVSFGPVSYCVQAMQWSNYGTNIVITNTFASSNSFCLTWTSLPGATYTVEGITNVTSTNWANVSGTIIATANTTTFCIALPSPFQYFRVKEGVSLSTYVPPPQISSIRRTFRGVELTWGGPLTARYQVEYTANLVPAVWLPVGPPVTSTTGLFRFLDDGSLTGGFAANRYYRILVLP